MIRFFEQQKERIAAVLLWLTVFVVYLNTLSPSVGFIDSGELAADVITLGIAHPTGYPFFTLLGRLFSLLPNAAEEIVRLNIFSAMLTSLASIIFFFFTVELLGNGKPEKRNEIIIASFISAGMLAFSRTFWFQGVAVEVYSLHLLLVSIMLFLFIIAVKTGGARWWILFAYVTGLSFTNHLTTILLAPALIYWFFAVHGVTKGAFKKIAGLAIPFIAGLSVYLYLPVRASQQPLFNWGNPQTFEKFFWHVSGKQFRVFMFSSGAAAKKQLDYFVNNLTNEFYFLVLAVAVAGFFILLFSDRKKFLVVLLLFATCVAYSVNYDIHDIDSYFLLAFIAIGIFTAYGVGWILRSVDGTVKKSAVVAAFVVLLVMQVISNHSKVDQRGNYLVEDYTKNILVNLPQNAIVLSYQWDYFVAASYYYQHVKNIRPDVVVIDKELIRRSWYYLQLENMYPELIQNSKSEYNLFLQELYKFEHDLPYNYTEIEGAYTALMKSFGKRSDSVAFFVTPEIEPQYTDGFMRIPDGFLFRVTKDTAYVAVPFPAITYRKYAGSDVYSEQINVLTVNALTRRGMYERFHGNDSLAALYLQKASKIHPKITAQVSNY